MTTRRDVTLGLAAAAVAGSLAPAVAAPAPVTVLEGAVGAKTAQAFFARVADFADRIVGLKAMLDPIDGLVAEADGDGALVVYLSRKAGAPAARDQYQLAFAGGFARDRSFWRLDGFYLVKYAGMGQGVLAYRLEPVKESEVLLSGAKLNRVRLR